jgi:hypothetical protein
MSLWKVQLFLSDVNKTWIFSTHFFLGGGGGEEVRKKKQVQIKIFVKTCPLGAELFNADGHDEANSRFSQFCERD